MLTKAMELEKAILEIICYTPNLKKGSLWTQEMLHYTKKMLHYTK